MNPISRGCLILLPAMLFLHSCTKTIVNKAPAPIETKTNPITDTGFTHYVIKPGEQFATGTGYMFKTINIAELHFQVIFDSTAIYKTDTSGNQADINKLYGFADNNVNDHHKFSARFGWNWYKGQLWLYAYVYNNSIMAFKNLGSIPLGVKAGCAIVVHGDEYLFVLNGVTTVMPRASTTATGIGYKLFPYFGGNETAPHQINIYIREVGN